MGSRPSLLIDIMRRINAQPRLFVLPRHADCYLIAHPDDSRHEFAAGSRINLDRITFVERHDTDSDQVVFGLSMENGALVELIFSGPDAVGNADEFEEIAFGIGVEGRMQLLEESEARAVAWADDLQDRLAESERTKEEALDRIRELVPERDALRELLGRTDEDLDLTVVMIGGHAYQVAQPVADKLDSYRHSDQPHPRVASVLGVSPGRELPDVTDVDVSNKAMVAIDPVGDAVVLKAGGNMERDQALVVAAWIVSLADENGRFAAILERITES